MDRGERDSGGGAERFAEAICPWREIIRPDSQGPVSPPLSGSRRFPVLEAIETLNNPARDSETSRRKCALDQLRGRIFGNWRCYGEEQLSLFVTTRLSVNNI